MSELTKIEYLNERIAENQKTGMTLIEHWDFLKNDISNMTIVKFTIIKNGKEFSNKRMRKASNKDVYIVKSVTKKGEDFQERRPKYFYWQ